MRKITPERVLMRSLLLPAIVALGLILGILLVASGVNAQTTRIAKKQKGLFELDTPRTITSEWLKKHPEKTMELTTQLIQHYSDTDVIDTVHCWFKEAGVQLWNNAVLKRPGKPDSLINKGEYIPFENDWQKGFYIIHKYGVFYKFQGEMLPLTVECFLYADKKTIVKNHVISYFKQP